MARNELLDHIFWHTLAGAHRQHSSGTDRARRYTQGFSPIIAFADPAHRRYLDMGFRDYLESTVRVVTLEAAGKKNTAHKEMPAPRSSRVAFSRSLEGGRPNRRAYSRLNWFGLS